MIIETNGDLGIQHFQKLPYLMDLMFISKTNVRIMSLILSIKIRTYATFPAWFHVPLIGMYYNYRYPVDISNYM